MVEHPKIGIIAKNDLTVSELLHYFAQVGASAKKLPSLRSWKAQPEESAGLDAVVIFPDDFEPEVVDAALAWISEQAPALLQLIVTRKPQRFLPSPADPADPPCRFIIPRPTFGWQILDALRAHRKGDSVPET